ncbi:MAG: carbohydrate-binding domain-containing protein, partial [Ruminococcaceae bacterium]|nr:carbohydrate-binding domain-containing protein [Oscillospiraceae bacterium]
MKHKLSKQILSTLLVFVMLVGLIPATALTVSAQNITGLMYASTVIADQGVVLMGDTHLYMDIDLSVPYIEGDYNLTIDGGGTLTIDGSGNGIDVKSLHCTSDLFVQPAWHAIDVTETVYIDNADSFIVGGIYAEGDIEIHSNNATIGGNGNAIFSNGGNITLSGDTFDIGANGIAVEAETGGIYMTGNFTVN